MNDNKCQKMMGRGVEGGCGTQEKSCRPCTRAAAAAASTVVEIGFYDQARKALTERCPFDSDEATATTSANNSNSRVCTLPVGLADSLSKYSHHSRKRHKKSDSQAATPRGGGSSSNIWVETEDYFRPVGLSDIENLFQNSSLASLAAHSSCFTIPPVDKTTTTAVQQQQQNKENVPAVLSSSASAHANANAKEVVIEAGGLDSQPVVVKEEKENAELPMEIDGVEQASSRNVEGAEEATRGNDGADEAIVRSANGVEEATVENVEEADEAIVGTVHASEEATVGNVDGAEEATAGNVDGAEEATVGNVDGAEEATVGNIDGAEEATGGNIGGVEEATDGAEANAGILSHLKESEQSLVSMPSSQARPSGVEWLLGSRDKLLLTTERPSKKRKFLGSDAGLDRLRVVCPSEGQGMPVCHVCCLGDLEEQSNQLLVCDSCKAAVHQKCYGVQELSVGLWLCSWCKYCGETGSELLSTPCFLCPKAGGALKPMAKDISDKKSSVPVRFIHLFCTQWMPEVYVEDTTKMEPIMNVGGIKETRKKLVCNICKVKYGACVRCSHGTCRTSFHPICARESRHRMEIWGKTGSETVELRAFCSKHSDFLSISAQPSISHSSVSVGCDSSVSKNLPVKSLVDKSHTLKLGRKNGDQNMALVPSSDTVSNKSGTSEVSLDQEASVLITNTRPESECHDAQSVSMEVLDFSQKTTEGYSDCNTKPYDSLDLVQVLKKLVDREKVSLRDVALGTGISSDTLAATLAGDGPSLFPHLHCKVLKWLRSNAYMGNPQSGSNSPASLIARVAASGGPNGVALEGSDNSEAVPLKSIPSRKPTNKIRIMKDNKVLTLLKQTDVQLEDKATIVGEVHAHTLISNGDMKEYGNSNGSHYVDGGSCPEDKDDEEKVSPRHSGYDDLGSCIEQSVRPKDEVDNGSLSEIRQVNSQDDSVRVGVTSSNGEHPVSSVDRATPVVPNLLSVESASYAHIHPVIRKRLMRLQNGPLAAQENDKPDLNGLNERASSSIDSNKKDLQSSHIDKDTSSAIKLEQLLVAKRMGILDLSPEDEVEGELIYFQNKLIDHAVTSRRLCDNLIFRVIKALPQELDAERKQRWDSVLVNQYISGLREAKKQGRKERKLKENEAVLAAATAAAAASSRISSFRKDSNDEAPHQEVSAVDGRTGPHSQMRPRAKETLSRLAVPRVSSEKPSDIFQLKSFMNEHQQLCDVCRRSETMLNTIVACCNCKVAVHLGCYRGVKDHVGPWYCELCEELLPFRSPRCPVQSREKSAVAAQCGLCGGSTGAFRKSTDGQWVHAFCAEWLLESTFRRGQPDLVEGMESIMKGRDFCCICSRKFGLCMKCNFGNCQSTFHPTCARNAGLYMHIKTGGGKLLHKAYCDKHSLEQREKAETQQHGPEALKAVKQIRVELERVRLLCERIIKREKVKRELVICSHNILASKRDSVAFSMLVRSPFFLPDVSSESATTSLRGGHVDDTRSCSEAMQRSEDMTVDSAVSSGSKRRDMPLPMDIDQRTDDNNSSSTSQYPPRRDRDTLFSGKKLPQRPPSSISSQILAADEEERRAKSRKHPETFQKELVMTSDQASVQNQRLPKGFVYVPIVCLPKEKPAVSEGEPDDG